MPTPIFRASQLSSPHISNAPIFLPPLIFPDGRVYDLHEVTIENADVYTPDESCVRWVTRLVAIDRSEYEGTPFSIRLFWSVVLRDGLDQFECSRDRAILKASVERVDEYLRFHPFPTRCCNGFDPICLEIF